jgi:hypothetical protein
MSQDKMDGTEGQLTNITSSVNHFFRHLILCPVGLMTLKCDKAKAGRLRTNNYLLKLVEVSPQPDKWTSSDLSSMQRKDQNTTECPLSLPT